MHSPKPCRHALPDYLAAARPARPPAAPQGIQKEYEELDTVWYLAGSLFNRQPFAPPTEQFSWPVFKQAFTAVQSSVVHLQGVPLGCAPAA